MSESLSTIVNPASLEELFARDPEKLSDQDIAMICTELRAKRLQWANEESTAKTQERRPRATKGAKLKVDLKQLTIKL